MLGRTGSEGVRGMFREQSWKCCLRASLCRCKPNFRGSGVYAPRSSVDFSIGQGRLASLHLVCISLSRYTQYTLDNTSLFAGKKCGIRAPFVARSLRFIGTPHRSFWMVCSCGHDRIAVTLERSRVRSVRSSNLTETAKMGVRRK
jgi:hypothetical protein